MRKQIIEHAAYEVATQVRAVEDSVDSALAEIAELQARILKAHSLAGVGFAAVHPTLEQLATAVSGLVATRGAISRTCAQRGPYMPRLPTPRARYPACAPSLWATTAIARTSPKRRFEWLPEVLTGHAPACPVSVRWTA